MHGAQESCLHFVDSRVLPTSSNDSSSLDTKLASSPGIRVELAMLVGPLVIFSILRTHNTHWEELDLLGDFFPSAGRNGVVKTKMKVRREVPI